ncbi:hypothetical protein [[Ruminococcus] lactaris]|uniref:hypothetical protein n=1 Tax=[Ruminococcus] lactaris TaxID=46228 RepID=UPI001D057718|nr:hypothetical protein [[Ruminococcus] lactaris]MCB5442411.1 hypothetical protein [[Ruminococcus] lactaris]MCB5532593.1 hypothetical protein [[Ruminococcus] lactaris]
MECKFQDIKEFENIYGNYYPSDICNCGGCREMELCTVTFIIGDKKIVVKECPVLVCKECENTVIGHRAIRAVYQTFFEFEKHPGENLCQVTSKGDFCFEYAKKAGFIYDSRDLNIPACDIDLDPGHTEGFSLPVYFDRKVLNNFYADDDYELDFFSESYGDIAKKGSNGWLYEWKIPFGINENDRVVLFLGDLDQIDDERSIFFLKSYNIPSDHKLVSTELYQAQMKCTFSEPVIEQRIIHLRQGFYNRVLRQYNIDLRHLEEEVVEKIKLVKKPVVYSEREVSGNIIALDGILNEGIDQDELRNLCPAVGVTDNVKQLKTRKLLQKIIAHKEGEDKAKDIIGPLFRLNDLRVIFAHLLPNEDIQECKDRIIEAYGLTDFSDLRKIYDTLLDELYGLYRFLNVAEF